MCEGNVEKLQENCMQGKHSEIKIDEGNERETAEEKCNTSQ